jgi:predicted RNA-binding protein YlqC (UPF0109 family)
MTAKKIQKYIEDLIFVGLELEPEVLVTDEGDNFYSVEITGDTVTMGHIIGRYGYMIDSLRNIIKAFASKNGIIVSVLADKKE